MGTVQVATAKASIKKSIAKISIRKGSRAGLLDAADHGTTMAKIAEGAGVGQSYFARVLRLNFLAPEIIKMILQGRQPPELTANRIMTWGKLSPSWAKQKEQLETSALATNLSLTYGN